MHRVLQHIDEHLDQQLELDDLAEVANFSSFHFHRLFTAWMGETLGEYLRRRRLVTAAQRMAAQPRLPILEVALGVELRLDRSVRACVQSQVRRDAHRVARHSGQQPRSGEKQARSGTRRRRRGNMEA